MKIYIVMIRIDGYDEVDKVFSSEDMATAYIKQNAKFETFELPPFDDYSGYFNENGDEYFIITKELN